MSSRFQTMVGRIEINFYLIYFVGAIGFVLNSVRPVMTAFTPAVLFITAIYALTRSFFQEQASARTTFLLWAVVVCVVTIFLEILGVRYGLFFGQYDYGRVLGPAVMGVPVIIGVNWLVVIMGATILSRKVTKNVIAACFLAGVMAFVFDFILEPVAIRLGFWQWVGPVPIKNYVSWFSITFIFSFAEARLKTDLSAEWTVHLLGAQFMFFAVIRVLMLFGVI